MLHFGEAFLKPAGAFFGESELVGGYIQRRDVQAHGLGILHGELAKAADPGNCKPLSRSYLGLLDTLVSGDAGTKYRRHFREIGVVRQATDIRSSPNYVLGEAAVDAVAGIMLGATEAPTSKLERSTAALCS